MSTALQYLVSDIGSTVNITLVLATVWVINNEYANVTTSAVIVGQYADSKTSFWLQNDLMEAVLTYNVRPHNKQASRNVKFVITSNSANAENAIQTSTQVLYRVARTRSRAIWFLNSLAAFGQLEADLLDDGKHYSRNGFFIIIYTGLQPERFDHIRVIFRRLFNIYVTNVNIFLIMDGYPVVLTYFPFSETKCHQSKPEFHVSFDGIREDTEFIINKAFFPSKVSNMHGCQMIVTTWNHPPFVYLENYQENPKKQRVHGIEGRLLSLLAETMNFSINIISLESKDNGYVYDNGTITGATKMIVEGKSNITIGSFMHEPKRAEVMLASISYMSSAMVVFLPKGSLLSPFERLTKPFQCSTWYCVSASIFIGVLVIFGVKLTRHRRLYNFVFGHHNSTPFTNLWNVLFGGLLHARLPRRNLARFLLGLFLIYTFVIRTAYIAELFLMLQDGRSRTPLKTLREVVERNYTFYTFPVLRDLLNDSKTINIHYVDRSKHSLDSIIDILATDSVKFVLTILEAMARSYNIQNRRSNKHIDILPEKLVTSPITLYMRKHSYLKQRVDDLLLNIMSAGIIEKFESDYLEDSMDGNKTLHEPVKLSLWLLLGLFGIYFVLLFLSFIVFLLEILSTKSKLIRRGFEFFNC